MSDLGLDRLLSVDEAIAILDALPVVARAPQRLAARSTILLDADVTADRDYPPFDKSLVDGYAVRAADLAVAPTTLPCVGEIAAGHAWRGVPIAPGTCVAIMTGAPLPPGAIDAVVPVEETTSIDDGRLVRFATSPKVGRSIAPRGSDVAGGAVVLREGAPIGPAQVAVLAQLGKLSRSVEAASAIGDAAVRAHILVTGDEVVPHHTFDPAPSAIRDSNGPMLVALLAALGVAATRSHVGDDLAEVRETIDRLTREHDLLFITGGMSMGRHDHVPATLRELGFDLPITKLRMKPGKPFVVAVRGARGEGQGARDSRVVEGSHSLAPRPSPLAPPARIVFGLPGNPVSGFCCTLRLAARVIRRMQGRAPGGDVTQAMLTTPLPANGPREFYQPATLDAGRATPLDWKGSADVFTLARADALIVRAADEPAQPAGAIVRILSLPR